MYSSGYWSILNLRHQLFSKCMFSNGVLFLAAFLHNVLPYQKLHLSSRLSKMQKEKVKFLKFLQGYFYVSVGKKLKLTGVLWQTELPWICHLVRENMTAEAYTIF